MEIKINENPNFLGRTSIIKIIRILNKHACKLMSIVKSKYII